MHIPFLRLAQHHEPILQELSEAVMDVLRSGQFILGPFVEKFESQFASYHNTPFAIGVNSGTDAIILALKSLGIGPGDEVITTSNSFITTVSSIELVGATPVLVDIGLDDNINVELIEEKITPRTKALLPVHWGGRPCNMDRIMSIAHQYDLFVVEDCAQAISARYKGQLVGTFGDCGAFSLHPFKTLGACGDAGIILTRDATLAEKIKVLRHNGLTLQGRCDVWSNNSRLDAIQAAILSVKMKYFENWTEKRIAIAQFYDIHLRDVDHIRLPIPGSQEIFSVYHTYIIKAQDRDQLQTYLKAAGIETRLHYNTPIHQQSVMKQRWHLPQQDQIAKEILSLPIYPELRLDELLYIVQVVKRFYSEQLREQKCESLILT